MWTAFESREFRWLAASQEFISIATVMTLRYLEYNLIRGGVFKFARINPHRHTGSLDRFGRFIWLAVPPVGHLLQLFFQRSELVWGEFHVLQPFFVLRVGQ